MRPLVDYIALSRLSDSAKWTMHEPLLKEHEEPQGIPRREHVLSDYFIFWSTAGVALTTMLSILVFFGALWNPHSQPTSSLVVRPNPYLYLDKILYNTTQVFPLVVNFPQVVLHFNAEDPGRRTQPESHRSKPTAFGTVYPDDRRIHISKSVSTIAQFWNLDYAMESCVVNLSLPADTDRFQPDVKLVKSSVVEIWTLEGEEELAQDIRGAPLASAPRRRALLATLPFPSSGSHLSPAFHCPSGRYTTLELACSDASAACHVDFWQDRRAKPIGGQSLSDVMIIM
ncbi:hypothetical protein BC628DRAFT_1307571 [Trametes gibbosa]|nr:hypothetical protein BC628DRAFT_1307571 [Trametes gibbosa]